MANQQAAVTVTGFVAGDPTLGGTESFRVLTFRMGSTRSRLNPTTRQWEDYGTAWVGVKAFRALAVNAASSVRRGDRIIVVGSPSSGPMSKANRAVEPFSKPPTLGMT